MAESGNGAMAARWESWFKVIFSLLMSVIAFVGVVLWDKVDNLNSTAMNLTVATTVLDGSLKSETQARQDLSGRVDDVKTSVQEMKGSVQSLGDKIDGRAIAQAAPSTTAVDKKLDKKLDQLSGQLYSLQGQLDQAASDKNRQRAKGKGD